MDIERFVQTRQHRWKRLEALLDLAEGGTARDVGKGRMEELVSLYRMVCSDLNEARSYTANPALLSGLNQLVGRAYRYVYRSTGGGSMSSAMREVFVHQIPAAFRNETRALLAAAVTMLAGVLFGLIAVLLDPANGQRLIPVQFFTERPAERVDSIERGKERIDSIGSAAAFSAELYTHNIRVAMLTFSLAALTIVGGVLLLFYNGVILGSVAAMYFIDGAHTFFFAWVGPHGALELPAIVFAGAAGLTAGKALLLPGTRSRAQAVRRVLPNVASILLMTGVTLVLAGLIEGSFSQFSNKTFPYAVKISVAASLFVLLLVYIFARGRRQS